MITPKSLDAYYTALASYRAQGVTNELGLRAAFANLLEAVGKTQGWTLVQEIALANRADDEEYIVRLVGRVITVSLETMRLVEALPPLE